jgi:hypothetical protein
MGRFGAIQKRDRHETMDFQQRACWFDCPFIIDIGAGLASPDLVGGPPIERVGGGRKCIERNAKAALPRRRAQLSLDRRASMLWFFGNAREHFEI